jgi:hypothetical protein
MEMPRTRKKKPPNPEGNPNFYSDKNPSKLKQEGDTPANALFGIRVPSELKEGLKSVPNSLIRQALWNLIEQSEPLPDNNPDDIQQLEKS